MVELGAVGGTCGLEGGEDVEDVFTGELVEVEVGGIQLRAKVGAFLFFPFSDVGDSAGFGVEVVGGIEIAGFGEGNHVVGGAGEFEIMSCALACVEEW